MAKSPDKTLETFPNPKPERDYVIEIETPEFTCLCPKTGQPDFATLRLEYVPDQLCVELKSLKLYIWSYRNEGHFHEKVTNAILSDLVAATQPRYMRVLAQFNVRGGLYTTVTAEHRRPGWNPPPAPPENLPRVHQSARDADATPASSAPAAVAPDRPAEPDQGEAPAARDAAEAAPAEPAPQAHGPRSERFRMLRRARGGAVTQATPERPAPEQHTPERPPPAAAAPRDVYIGMDIGTTGCRAVAVDASEEILGFAEAPLAPPARHDGQVTQDPGDWWKAVGTTLKELAKKIDFKRVHRIGVAGTSGTLLLCDAKGAPMSPGLMYNDRRAHTEADRIAEVADETSAAFGPESSLAKLMWLQANKGRARAAFALHQADWIAGRLLGAYGHSDYHNSLRLGYDPQGPGWPDWFTSLGLQPALLPRVHAPGEVIDRISASAATVFGLPRETEIVAGTTDSVAAFVGAGAAEPGHGVTLLGSALALTVLGEERVVSRPNGVYSQRLGRYWLAGGTSASGGNVLLQYFSLEQLQEMTPLLDPQTSTDLNYYPLAEPGERFPIYDPRMPPKLEPLPGDSLMFLQGILEGMANIEAEGYAALAELGAPSVTAIWTAGSGARNPAWTGIRERILGTRLRPTKSGQPAFGAALLAAGVLQKRFA